MVVVFFVRESWKLATWDVAVWGGAAGYCWMDGEVAMLLLGAANEYQIWSVVSTKDTGEGGLGLYFLDRGACSVVKSSLGTLPIKECAWDHFNLLPTTSVWTLVTRNSTLLMELALLWVTPIGSTRIV